MYASSIDNTYLAHHINTLIDVNRRQSTRDRRESTRIPLIYIAFTIVRRSRVNSRRSKHF